MKILFTLFGAILMLTACNWGDHNIPKPDINTDTLTFTYDTIKNRAPDCGNKPDSMCTVASIIYPQFIGQDQLNDSLVQKLMLSGFNNPDKKPGSSLQSYASNFIKSYVSDDTRQSRPGMYYTLELKAVVLRQDSSLTTLQIDGYTYTGGAHGSSLTTYINWNTKGRHNINLSEILIDNNYHKLTAIADTIFRQNEKIDFNTSLNDNYFFANGKFELNDNFLITPTGIKFLYNQYEIKPYAAGQTELNIPYTKIKNLLRPNTVVTQFIK